MRIVVLDGYALNPGDLSWAPLEALGELEVHPRTPPGQVVARAAGAPFVLTNKTPLGLAEFGALPELRYVGVLATGTNVVDVAAAASRGIAVTNVPGYSTPSVAQMTFALLLELTHAVGDHARGVRAGRWCVSPDFSYWESPLVELAGLTFGIVGFGAIGRAVAGVAEAFGMRVVAHTRAPSPEPAPGIRFVGLDDLFRESDVVSLHCPLTEETRGLVDARRLALMKPTAYLLNTARGPLVDERALADALGAGCLAGVGLDVLCAEPPRPGNPLLTTPRCLITPHIGWATKAARRRLLGEAAENLRAFVEGRSRNRV